MPTLADVGPHVKKKLVNMLGEERASELVSEILPAIGLKRLLSPDDRHLFGGFVAQRGGMFVVLGKSIQTQAILHGAFHDMERRSSPLPPP
jgi:hypothetical protein